MDEDEIPTKHDDEDKPPKDDEESKPVPKGREFKIDGHRFWCEPATSGDPAAGRPYKHDGIEYWCEPCEQYFKRKFGRRYDSKGRIDPTMPD